MLTVKELTKIYGKKTVLTGASFSVPPGIVTGLLGPNGSGKSTCLHIVAGLTAPTSGVCTIGDAPRNSDIYRNSLGFCPDDLPQPDLLTAQEYLDLMQGIRGIKVPEESLTMMLTGFRLADYRKSLIGSFSHGMKRKLQLIAALLHAPDILILDEPFRGLDPESASIVNKLIQGYVDRGKAVLLSTHDLFLAERVCQKVVVLSEGKQIAYDDTKKLMHQEGHDSLEDSFLAVTGLDRAAAASAELFFDGLTRVEAIR